MTFSVKNLSSAGFKIHLTMSVVNVESFHEGLPSQLSLFDLPPTQVAVSDTYYQEIRPVSQISMTHPRSSTSPQAIIWTIWIYRAHRYTSN